MISDKEIQYTNTLEALERWAGIIIDEYKKRLSYAGNDKGELYNTISFSHIDKTGAFFIININVANYFWYYEHGRRAGKWPPIDKIFQWVVKKNIIPRPLTLKTGKTIIPTQKTLAFLIARSIGKHGTRPHPLFSDTVSHLREAMVESISEALARDLETEIDIKITI